MTTRAVDSYLSIPAGSFPSEEEDPVFSNTSVDTLWGRNLVFDLQGNPVPLPGPIHIVNRNELAGTVRKKQRFVEVLFFIYSRSGNYAADPEGRLYARAYGWQGDNQLIHLLEPMSLCQKDPFGEASVMQIELTPEMLQAKLASQAERIEREIEAEEAKIHQHAYGMEEHQDLVC